jgi:adenosine deaminase
VDGLPLYGAEIRQIDTAAEKMVRTLAAQPKRLRTLRGVDICGVEADQPLWVSAESLRYVRTRSSEIAARRPELNLQPLRLTLHAGEDFGWLTSGVRAVAEPFHWKLIQRGDRLGHGIAITFKPEEWWKRKEGQVIKVKRFDRLLDLAFLAQYTAQERTAEQDAWLLDQIRATVEDLHFRRKPNAEAINLVETAMELWRALGGRLTRRLIDRPGQGSNLKPHERWIHNYLWSRSLQKHAHELIRLKVDDDRGELRITGERNECDLLVIARKNLIREVARWQVCIESNPSSNLVVGGLDAMGASQDFLQRRPTTHNDQVEETLTWTISTDDPITFSTTLADEYAYAWAGMVLRKDRLYDPAYARALLDEAAATSMRTRFTVPDPEKERSDAGTRERRRDARPYR